MKSKLTALFLAWAATAMAADAANDLLLQQRKADNSGTIQRNVAPDANSLLGFDGSKVAAKVTVGSGLSLSGGTLTASGGTGTVTSFSAGDLSPLFTTSEANATTTPALTFSLSNAAQNAVFAGPGTGGSGAPSYRALVALDIPTLTLSKISDAGDAAALDVGTTAGTVAAGDDSRITGAVQTSRTINGQALSSNVTLTTADIADSTDKRYVTDAQLTVLGNTSGTNTGDQNLFGSVVVSGQTTVTPGSTTQALTLAEGSNVTITTNNTTKTVTIAASGGGGGTWGSITGTLSDQTDLQSALDAKVATTRTISTTSPLSGGGDLSANRTLTIADAAADGSTKGAASFTAADFDASSGNISIDYTNGQAAATGTKGFLTGTDWDTFNAKVATTRTISTTSPLSGGGDLSANRTLTIADAAADGSTKGAASFTAADFNASSGNIAIDYTNGQAASGSTKGFLTSADWTTFNGKVGTGAITSSGLTMATARLLGRTTASSGAVEEIAVSGATLSGGTLTITSSTADGWNAAGETWTYASATSFTVASDVTSIYAKGDKLKLTQTTVRYFYVVGVSYSSPNTTITVTGGSDYSLANASITSPYYSKSVSPVGFPQWFNWTPTLGGFSADPTTTSYRFSIIGTSCSLMVRQGVAGTSNATTFTLTLPVTAATVTNAKWDGNAGVSDNGSNLTTPGVIDIASAATSASFFKDYNGGTWTASGGKRAAVAQVTYEF